MTVVPAGGAAVPEGLPEALFMSVRDLTGLLGISDSTVYRLLDNGDLGDSWLIGRSRRMSPAGIRTFLRGARLPACVPVEDPLAVTYVRVKWISGALRVSQMTVYRLIYAGAFAGTVKIGGATFRVPQESVEDYLAGSVFLAMREDPAGE